MHVQQFDLITDENHHGLDVYEYDDLWFWPSDKRDSGCQLRKIAKNDCMK